MSTRYSSDEVIINSGISLNHVSIVQRDGQLAACCGGCLEELGWTWDGEPGDSTGFWSCLGGCQTVYENEYGPRTASMLYIDMASVREDRRSEKGRSRRDGMSLSGWISGWLGRDVETLEVKVEW